MLNLPTLPQTRITRQLQCVCCREKFAIAEDDAVRNGKSSKNWRLPPDGDTDTQFRYQPDRSRRSVVPGTRAVSSGNPADSQRWNNERQDEINCPRCGADNRNWMHILHPQDVRPSNWFWAALPRKFLIWQRRFPTALTGIALSSSLALPTFIYFLGTEYSTPLSFFLLLFIIITAIAPAQDLTTRWRKLRESEHLRKVPSIQSVNEEATMWLRGFALILLGSFVLPLIFFQFGPHSLSFIFAIIQPAPEKVVDNAAAPYLNALDTSYANAMDEASLAIEDAMKTLDDLPTADSRIVDPILEDFRQDLDEILENVASSAYPATIRQKAAMETFVKDAKVAVRKEHRREIDKALDEVTGDIGYLALWGLTVGLSSLLSVFTTMSALKEFVKKINAQLPPPLCHSVANMTRVVVWEAKRSLEIGDEVHQIQWTRVERNDEGGIVLVGLFRDEPTAVPQDDFPDTRALAQQYAIISDKWGRIVKAEIKSRRVLKRPRQSQQEMAALFFEPVSSPVEGS
ncbi:MAG: hypothetical protein GY803_16810 [Chloroflexi bacterium]|nr:hypothetical protein [Chloroflexota bacterium]